jgi:hypothetical protein
MQPVDSDEPGEGAVEDGELQDSHRACGRGMRMMPGLDSIPSPTGTDRTGLGKRAVNLTLSAAALYAAMALEINISEQGSDACH